MKRQLTFVFFCDNCGGCRTSSRHKVRITREGSEITSDTCEICGITQEIEIDGNSRVNKHRIKNDGATNG